VIVTGAYDAVPEGGSLPGVAAPAVEGVAREGNVHVVVVVAGSGAPSRPPESSPLRADQSIGPKTTTSSSSTTGLQPLR
jgi:hypothetical protein